MFAELLPGYNLPVLSKRFAIIDVDTIQLIL